MRVNEKLRTVHWRKFTKPAKIINFIV